MEGPIFAPNSLFLLRSSSTIQRFRLMELMDTFCNNTYN